jgi:hypothetical protein
MLKKVFGIPRTVTSGAKQASEKGLIAASCEGPGLKPFESLAFIRGAEAPRYSGKQKRELFRSL